MAIDTAEKRRSLVGPSFHYYNPGVTPNASPDSEWRQQSGHGYSGIAPQGSQPEPEDVELQPGLLVNVGRLIN